MVHHQLERDLRGGDGAADERRAVAHSGRGGAGVYKGGAGVNADGLR